MSTNYCQTPRTTFLEPFASTPQRGLDSQNDDSKKTEIKTNKVFQDTRTRDDSRSETLTRQKANHQSEENETQNSDIDYSDTDYSELDKLFIDYSDINDLYIDDSVGKQTGLEMIDIQSWKLGVRSPAEGFLDGLNGFIPVGHTNSSGDIGK